jgi:ribosomal protein S18 acetylase RimI-like enzyme
VTVEIRRAELTDLNALVTLHEEVHALHLAARPDQFKVADRAAFGARLRELLGSSDAKVWVATLYGGVVGYVVSVFIRRQGHQIVPSRTWCDIDQIGVLGAQRRKGIATLLINTAVTDARASGVQEIELNSWAFNSEAHAAFQRLGFTPKTIRFELKR